MNIRLIPRLDIKGSNLVKGINLEGLRVLGKPEAFARAYDAAGADELLFIDIVASLYERNSLLHIVERTARDIHIPLTVGGGLRSLDDIRDVLRAGADKVALNTAAIRDFRFVAQACERFGASTIVVSIEAARRPEGGYECYTDNGRTRTGLEVADWARRVAELGAGEILLTSVEREGTGKGYDLGLTRSIAQAVSIPVIACGGAGSARHVLRVVEEGLADAASLASIIHFPLAVSMEHDFDAFTEGNVEFLRHIRLPGHMDCSSLSAIRQLLSQRGFEGRQSLANPERAHDDATCQHP